jgi:hypothetical protein
MIEDFLHLQPVSMTLVANLELRISPRIFENLKKPLEPGLRIRIRIRIWIRINLSCWIQIRNLTADPDPGGQKLPTKIEKVQNFHVLKCWMFSFEG